MTNIELIQRLDAMKVELDKFAANQEKQLTKSMNAMQVEILSKLKTVPKKNITTNSKPVVSGPTLNGMQFTTNVK